MGVDDHICSEVFHRRHGLSDIIKWFHFLEIHIGGDNSHNLQLFAQQTLPLEVDLHWFAKARAVGPVTLKNVFVQVNCALFFCRYDWRVSGEKKNTNKTKLPRWKNHAVLIMLLACCFMFLFVPPQDMMTLVPLSELSAVSVDDSAAVNSYINSTVVNILESGYNGTVTKVMLEGKNKIDK